MCLNVLHYGKLTACVSFSLSPARCVPPPSVSLSLSLSLPLSPSLSVCLAALICADAAGEEDASFLSLSSEQLRESLRRNMTGTNTHTFAHTRTHARARAHTHTRTHTYTQMILNHEETVE